MIPALKLHGGERFPRDARRRTAPTVTAVSHRNLLAKLKARDRTEAVTLALRRGLITLDA